LKEFWKIRGFCNIRVSAILGDSGKLEDSVKLGIL
jgi:hypothetical protein